MAEMPKINTGLLYGIVADVMPMEGRDFTISTAFDENKKPRLSVMPLTDIGKAFVPLLVARLAKPMGDNGVTVAAAGPVAQEVVTITSIRRRVEEEAATARQAKLKEAETNRKAKFDAVEAARKARIAKSGEKSSMSQEEIAANRAAQQAAIATWRLKAADAKINGIRESVDAAARQAAEQDAKNGKSWAVDMDAPLTSLFDRQDVTSKMTLKERLIAQIAAHAVEQDDLHSQAVTAAKQYIIPLKK